MEPILGIVNAPMEIRTLFLAVAIRLLTLLVMLHVLQRLQPQQQQPQLQQQQLQGWMSKFPWSNFPFQI